MHTASIVFTIVLLLFVHAVHAEHTALPDGVTPLEATWLWGQHAIPDTISNNGLPYWYAYPHTNSARINDPPWTDVAATHVKLGASTPAVVFLHGCSGMIRGSAGYRVLLLEMGFAIFEPDAYARPGHTCDSSSATKRREEAKFALEKIRQLSWVNQDRVVLIGFSEGGRAASMWDETGYAAIVIIGSRATPTAPEGVPVLAVAGSDDSRAQPATYAVNWKPPSRAVLIEEGGHEIISHPEFKAILRDFLTEVIATR